jgi:hypothetical protein
MPDQIAVWTLEQVEAAVRVVLLEQLLARYRDCVAGGHVWRPLESAGAGVVATECCAWCLRVRIGNGV